jgi:hypothetical protein
MAYAWSRPNTAIDAQASAPVDEPSSADTA